MISYDVTQESHSMVLTLYNFSERVADAYSAKQLRLPVSGDVVVVTGVTGVAEAKYEAKLVNDLCLKDDITRTRFRIISDFKYVEVCPYAKVTQALNPQCGGRLCAPER